MNTNITNLAIKGTLWASLQRFGVMIINLASSVVLARLLTPSDFGIIGMLMIFISVSTSLIDGGFGSALIQKENPTETDYSTIFYINLIFSVVLYLALYFSSPAIAKFYNQPVLESVLSVLGIVLFFNALSIVQQNQLRKKMNFRLISIVNLSSSAIALLVGVLLAYRDFGVWSLVYQQLTFSLCNAILFWILSNWRPRLVLSIESLRELFSFGGYILLSNLISTISNEIQGLLVGKRFPPKIMGYYSQAFRLEATASTSISSIISQVTYPMFSALQNESDRFLNALRNLSKVTIFISCAILGLMIIAAKPIIVILLSDKWTPSIPYFQILCVAGVAVCLQSIAQDSLAALGMSRILFRWTMVKRISTIVLCVIGIELHGMNGLLWSIVLGAWMVHFVNMYLMHKYINYGVVEQLQDLIPSILLAFVVGAGTYFLVGLVNLNLLSSLCCTTIFFLLLYFAGSKLFKFKALSLSKNMVMTLFGKN